MGYITDIYAGFSFASTCPFPDTTFADGRAICDWAKRFTYVTDPDEIPADQTNYPCYLDETCFASPAVKTEFFTNVRADGGDIRVTLSDGFTEIPFHVIEIDTVGETLKMRYRIAGTTSSTVATTVYIYSGNAVATGYADSATYGRNNTYQDFGAYYLMLEDPSGGAPQLVDVTGKSNDMTMSNMEAGDMTTQPNGMNAYTFDGVNEFGNKDTPGFQGNTSGAVSMWVKINSVLGAQGSLSLAGYGGAAAGNAGVIVLQKRRFDAVDTDTHFAWTARVQGSSNIRGLIGDTVLVAGTTYFVTFVNEGGGLGQTKIYVNGVAETLTQWIGTNDATQWFSGTNASPTTKFRIADLYVNGASNGLLGDDTIGPLAVHSSPPSANLVQTIFNNESAPGTFGQVTGWVSS